MIVGIRGKQGNGKTATLAWLAHHYHSLGFEIYANFWINDIDFHYVTCVEDIEKIRSGYAFFDEFFVWIDSRVSGYSDINMLVTGILMKARKRGYSLFYESKLVHMIDRRIRENTDYVLEPDIYFDQNGTLEKIEQSMLHPIDLKPHLDQLWVLSEKYEFNGENLKRMDGDQAEVIQFSLSSVMNTYDTKEEISGLDQGERSAGLEKGMKVENVFAKHLQSLFPSGEIQQGKLSRGWDVVLKDNGSSAAYDVVHVNKSGKSHNYPWIDLRGKHIKDLLKAARKSKLKPFWAFNLEGKWYTIPMTDEHALKSTLSCKNRKELGS